MKTSPEVNIQIGKNLRRVREMRGFSQDALAFNLKPSISFQQIQKYEKGKNRISVATLIDITRALECNIEDLLADVYYTTRDMVTDEYDVKLLHQFNLIPDEEVQKSVKSLVNALARYLNQKELS